LLGAEIDALYDAESLPIPKNYVEFKTTRELKNSRDREFFERNTLLKYWAQSYLANVPKILCGYRDMAGNIKRTEWFETLKIPRIVRRKSHAWDGQICLNFADRFLSWLNQVISNDADSLDVWCLSFKPSYQKLVLKKEKSLQCFLPDWYISQVYRLAENEEIFSADYKKIA
jgi:RAT1-interacting protein